MSSILSQTKYKVRVGRMGSRMEEVEAKKGLTAQEVIDSRGFVVGNNESVYINGEKVDKSSLKERTMNNGDVIAIAGAKEGGRI